MQTLSGNNNATLIPPWATTALPYTYDAAPTHCSPCTYDALCDYDDTRCANSRTSSTSVTTRFYGETGFEDNCGLFEDSAGGHEQDAANYGMSLYGYRYYKPELGRWVNWDPIGERGGVNIYGFVGNDSIIGIDPDGQLPVAFYAAVKVVMLAGTIATAIVVDGTFKWIRDIWAEKTLQMLPAGPPKLLWSRSRDGALDGSTSYQLRLDIDSSTQSTWGNIVDLIEASPVYITARDQIVQTVMSSSATSGGDAVSVYFGSSELQLHYSLKAANVSYTYEFSESPCHINVKIIDYYNYDHGHVWRKMQDKGELIPCRINIQMPNLLQ